MKNARKNVIIQNGIINTIYSLNLIPYIILIPIGYNIVLYKCLIKYNKISIIYILCGMCL